MKSRIKFLAMLAVLCGFTSSAKAVEVQTCSYDQFKYGNANISTLSQLYRLTETDNTIPHITYQTNACYSHNNGAVKVRFADITKSSAPQDISVQEVGSLISELNSNFGGSVRFEPYSIERYRLSDADYATATTLGTQRKFFMRYYTVPEQLPVLTVFLMDDMKSDATSTCSGIEVVPAGNVTSQAPFADITLGYVTISKNAQCRTKSGTLGATLTHQMGHIFGLADTHNEFTNIFVGGPNGKEFVDRQKPYPYSCWEKGDLLCDTPASPNLYNKTNQEHYITRDVQGDCSYNGSLSDSDGAEYDPSVENFMSETFPTCMKSFTPNQLSLVQQAAQKILCTKEQNPVPGLRGNPKISIFPNPVVGGQLHISISENAPQPTRNFDVAIFDMTGKLVKKTTIESNGRAVTIPLHVARGKYVVRTKSDFYVQSFSIIVQ